MGNDKRFVYKIIAIIIVIIIIAYCTKRLWDFITYEILESYAEWYHGYESVTIEESKVRGAFLWEYEVDSIILVDTFCFRPTYAFAERRWFHNRINPDSLFMDSIAWQAVIGIQQIKDIPDYQIYTVSDMAHHWQLKSFGDSTVSFIYSNYGHPVPPKDTVKYYILYHAYKDSDNVYLKYRDTLTLYLTRKYEIKR